MLAPLHWIDLTVDSVGVAGCPSIFHGGNNWIKRIKGIVEDKLLLSLVLDGGVIGYCREVAVELSSISLPKRLFLAYKRVHSLPLTKLNTKCEFWSLTDVCRFRSWYKISHDYI